jgi:hypothetical protein
MRFAASRASDRGDVDDITVKLGQFFFLFSFFLFSWLGFTPSIWVYLETGMPLTRRKRSSLTSKTSRFECE